MRIRKAIQADPILVRVTDDGRVVGRMTIADKTQSLPRARQTQQTAEDSRRRALVSAASGTTRTGGNSPLLGLRAPSRPSMRRGIEGVDEPGILADCGPHSERQVLRELEGLEVIDHDRLPEIALEIGQRQVVQKQRMASQARAEPGHGGGCAAE